MHQIQTNLSYLRALAKLTQREVAQATGISQKTLSALETGVSQGMEFSTLAKLCAFFRCDASDILSVEEIPENIPPSSQALSAADALIARGMKAAMESPKQTVEEIWAEFEAMRQRLQESAHLSHITHKQKSRFRRA